MTNTTNTSSQFRLLVIDVEACSGLEVHDHGGDSGWKWVDLKIDDPDPVGMSEIVSDLAKYHDFDLCSVDFENQIIRLNRQR